MIFVLAFYLWRHSDELSRILALSLFDVLSLALLFIGTQYLNGLRLRLLLNKVGVDLGDKECFHLSNVNTMANYLPFKGGTLATALYFKNKHNVSYGKFANIIIANQIFYLLTIGLASSFLILTNYFISGIFLADLFYFFCLLSFLTALSVFMLKLMTGAKILLGLKIEKINNIASEANRILSDNKLLASLLYINILAIAAMGLRFFIAFRALNYKTSFILPFLAGQAKTLAVLINLTPSGIGVAELSAGIVSGLTDKNINIGIYAASIDRIVSILALFVIFTFAIIYFRRNVRTDIVEKTNAQTKEAWGDNWRGTTIKTVLEIFDYPRVKQFFSMIEPHIPKKGRILEAGCGLGPWVIKLSSLGYDAVGIDYQNECIDKIKQYDERQNVYTADVRNIPFKDRSFSAYLSWGVIEHFAEGPDAVLKEACRVLDNGGKLILTVPYKNIFIRIKEPLVNIKRSTFIRRVFGKPQKTYYYQKYFGVRELEKVIAENGFSIERTSPVDHIFSLVEFSGIFRNRNSYDGENKLAVFLGGVLKNILPWQSAGSILIVAHKRKV